MAMPRQRLEVPQLLEGEIVHNDSLSRQSVNHT
jgi:hypothetical protein